MKRQGVYTALVTPFLREEIDEEMLRIHLQRQIKANVAGVVALGTTGEAPTLEEREQERIIRIAREETDGKCELMVGTGSYSTKKCIALTKRAEMLDADVALIIAPYYNRPTQEGLFLHYKAVHDATNLPIIIYQHEKRTGVRISLETLKRLSDLPRIAGIKAANGDLHEMQEIVSQIMREREDFSLFTGCDDDTLLTLTLGGDGVISVVSNLFPELMCDLVHAALDQDLSLARTLHNQLLPLFRASSFETNPIPIKAMMEMAGLGSADCRLPLTRLAAQYWDRIQAVLEEVENGTKSSL